MSVTKFQSRMVGAAGGRVNPSGAGERADRVDALRLASSPVLTFQTRTAGPSPEAGAGHPGERDRRS
jgi:hypothetical protein